MFSHHISQHTRPFVAILLALSLTLTLLWLLGGAFLPAYALPGEHTQSLASSATLTVTNANDDGPGSLRQAIDVAADGDIIIFDNDYSIYLSSTLNITKQLTIDGGTYTITVSGDSLNDGSRNVRVFKINTNKVVTLSHLAIVSGTFAAGGDGVGIIIYHGTVLIRNCTIADNLASSGGGGIYNEGTLTVEDSIFSANHVTGNNGGGIYNDYGALKVTNSTFLGNSSAFNGGGIYSQGGTLTVRDSTFVDNSAVGGGGIFASYSDPIIIGSTFYHNLADAIGGGIDNSRGTLTIKNSTFSENLSIGYSSFAGGGAISQYGTSFLENVTFSGNDAPNMDDRDGIWLQGGNMTLRNVLLADNGAANCTVTGGSLIAMADNLSDDTTCAGVTQVSDAALLLPPLADNGGPTWTHALLPRSPAIDAGDDETCLPIDQRGVARPQGPHCDIGAYEAPFAPSIYTLSVATAGNGAGTVTANPSGPSYPQGTVVTLTATPLISSTFVSFSDDVIMITPQITLTMDTDKTITATFALKAFVLTPIISVNGSITPSTPQTVNYGASQTFTITPDANYHIIDVGVDGVSQGALTGYAFNNVTANHTIAAAFAINTFSITPTAGANGSITPPTLQTVNYGASQTFTITPDANYHNVDVGVDGVSQGALTSYTFNNVTTNHTISAAFAINVYALTLNRAGDGLGSVIATPPGLNYAAGTMVTLTAVSSSTSRFIGWSGDVISTTNPFIVSMDSDKAITATFVTYRVHLPLVLK